jgi:solute carrier family 25 carnitine/acylcarnitine transporter 20/29
MPPQSFPSHLSGARPAGVKVDVEVAPRSDARTRPTSVMTNVVAGAVQATLVTIVGFPFDTVKTRLQTGAFRNSMHCLRATVTAEGVLALYRGGTMPWLSHLVKRPLQFPLSEYLKREELSNNYVIGGVTGPIGALFGTPLQVIKVGMQTSGVRSHQNSATFATHHFSRHGLAGFYRGLLPTMAKDCLFGASFVGHYYTLRDYWGTDRWYKNFASGAIAHCATWGLLIPIDYVKTTIQRSTDACAPTVRHVVRDTIRRHGVRAFWKGIGPACARTIPVSGIAMTGYEYIRRVL